MPYAVRAALGGVALALALAPAGAQAAPKKPAKLSVSTLGKPPSTADAGTTFKLSARFANAKNRKTATGRVTLSLRPSSGKATNLRAYSLKSVKAGKSRRLTLSITVPSTLKAGTYSLRVCVRRTGTSGATCKTAGRIKVTVKPTPRPAPAPTPAPTAVPQPAPSPTATPAPTVTGEALENAVTLAGLRPHLEAFQEAADFNGGNRASGLQGYGASQAYVIDVLRKAGYQPRVQAFEFLFFRQLDDSVMQQTAPTARTFVEDEDFILMTYSGAGDVTAPVRAIDLALTPPRASTSGCEAADFAALQEGEIALMQRGTCDFGTKVANAEEAGAGGAIIFNQGNTDAPDRNEVFAGTLGGVVGIPAVGVSYEDGVALQGATVRLVTDTKVDPRTTTNVLADTAGGDPANTVVVGAHLDSVPEGPGINDNGTGSALVLETAVQMAKMAAPANKVRFAWWGAEEEGLLGATHYIADISDEEFAKLAMNLNFDMIGSPNPARFVYDGDFSDTDPPASAPTVNPGSAEIEQTFLDYYASRGLATEPSAFDGRSDYKPFQDNGVPAGGIFSGAEVEKTPAQVTKWGGLPNVAFDVNYHGEGDDITNVDLPAYEQLAKGGAFVTGTYAARTLHPAVTEAAKVHSARTVATKSERLGHKVQR